MNWIADTLARMNNALLLNRHNVIVRGTKLVLEVLKAMKQGGFITDFEPADVANLKQAYLVHFRYLGKKSAIRELKYKDNSVQCEDLYKYVKKFSCPIVSTSSGVMLGNEAYQKGIGGILLCEVK